jgi:hypothetical protein
MSLAHSPSIVTDALILALDAGNAKSHNSSENLILHSQSFNNWSVSNTTATADQATAPDGTLTADLVSNTAFTASYIAINTALSPSTTYTFSLYVKPLTINKIVAVQFDTSGTGGGFTVPIFDLAALTSSGGGTNRTITDVGNGWYRISFNITTLTGPSPSGPTIYLGSYGTTGNSVSMYFWGAQITKSLGPVPYVATTTSAISRSTAWSDLSGNGNNGTIISGSTYSPSNQGSVFFDGSFGQHVNIRSNARILSNVTYTKQIWLNTNNTGANNNIISSNIGEHFLYLNSLARPWAGHPPEYNSIISSITLLANTWYNVAVTFDSSVGWKMYINGVLNNTTASTTAFTQFSDVAVGAFLGGSSFYGNLNGALIYNKVLTASEVLQNFNAQRGRYGL